MLGEREDVVGWPEARKKLANGEKFLALLSSFEVQGLTEKKLRLIEPYVRNPRFNPAAIEPISHCAAKLCAWYDISSSRVNQHICAGSGLVAL